VALFRQPGLTPDRVDELSPIPPEVHLFARIEHLVGEEARLLAEWRETRKEEHRERLRAISNELDGIWEMLRERAERLGRPGAASQADAEPGLRENP
jgi:hypothetical protein